jgi:hypothetical protein
MGGGSFTVKIERAVRKFQMLNLYAVSQEKKCYVDSIIGKKEVIQENRLDDSLGKEVHAEIKRIVLFDFINGNDY